VIEGTENRVETRVGTEPEKKDVAHHLIECDECGSYPVEYTGRCWTCRMCGASKCSTL
jgi:hypothetical protein